MTKQEKIRERVMLLLYPDKERIEHEWGGCNDAEAKEDSYGGADEILKYLHSQGVVIKVERELPKIPPYSQMESICGSIAKESAYKEAQQEMLKWHEDSLEPLIEKK